MKTKFPKALFVACVLSLSLSMARPISAEPLADVLSRMDRASTEFRSVTAKMKRVQFTAVLSESSEMNGTMRLRRAKNGTAGVIEFLDPEPRTVIINGHNVVIFYPKANTAEYYDTSKYASNIDQLLLLGFGTSSVELSKSYDLKEGGSEKIGGVNTTRIELTAKTTELKKLITKIELWIPEGEGNPIREKITEPSKNYELVDYSDIKVNPSLPDSAYEFKLPAKVHAIHPQK